MTARLCVAPSRLVAGRVTIDGDDHAYLFRVRRLAVGDAVVLFDGAGREAPAVAVEIGPARAVLEVEAPRDVRESADDPAWSSATLVRRSEPPAP